MGVVLGGVMGVVRGDSGEWYEEWWGVVSESGVRSGCRRGEGSGEK